MPIAQFLLESVQDCTKALEEMYAVIDFDDRDMDDARNEFEEDAGEEKECIEFLLEAYSYYVRIAGANILASIEIIQQMANAYMSSNFEYIRFIGVCLLDDLIKYNPSTIEGIIPQVLDFFGNNMQCEDPALRQAVLYGIKLIVEQYPAVIQPQCQV